MKLAPGDRIGIIGGGQLGRMMAMAAARLGFNVSVLDPQENAPAFQCSDEPIIAAYDDHSALEQMIETCQVVTYEFENVDVETIRNLEDQGQFFPSSLALATSQDRMIEKQFFNNLGIATAPWATLEPDAPLAPVLETLGGSAIIKTRRFGYDGKGQIRVTSDDKASILAAERLASQAPCIAEGMVEFEREISIIAARSANGNSKAYDLAENVHKNGILHTSTIPAHVSPDVQRHADEIGTNVLNALNYVGILAIEFFQLPNGDLLVNEFAPRVHNSGHWTEAACHVSQFEQHIRAIAGLPLANTDRHSNCVMENLIGSDVERVDEIHEFNNTKLHLYGKDEVRDGRKMGHFTTLTPKD